MKFFPRPQQDLTLAVLPGFGRLSPLSRLRMKLRAISGGGLETSGCAGAVRGSGFGFGLAAPYRRVSCLLIPRGQSTKAGGAVVHRS